MKRFSGAGVRAHPAVRTGWKPVPPEKLFKSRQRRAGIACHNPMPWPPYAFMAVMAKLLLGVRLSQPGKKLLANEALAKVPFSVILRERSDRRISGFQEVEILIAIAINSFRLEVFKSPFFKGGL